MKPFTILNNNLSTFNPRVIEHFQVQLQYNKTSQRSQKPGMQTKCTGSNTSTFDFANIVGVERWVIYCLLLKVLLDQIGALVHWVSFFFFNNVDGPSFKTGLPSQRIHWSGKAKYTNWHRLISISGVYEWMGTPRCYCLWMEKGYPLIFWSETQWQLGTLQCQVASEPIVYSNAPAGKAAKILLNGETKCWTLNLCRGMFQL